MRCIIHPFFHPNPCTDAIPTLHRRCTDNALSQYFSVLGSKLTLFPPAPFAPVHRHLPPSRHLCAKGRPSRLHRLLQPTAIRDPTLGSETFFVRRYGLTAQVAPASVLRSLRIRGFKGLSRPIPSQMPSCFRLATRHLARRSNVFLGNMPQDRQVPLVNRRQKITPTVSGSPCSSANVPRPTVKVARSD